MNKKLLFIFSFLLTSYALLAQEGSTHSVFVEIENNAFMCPNLSMKINRTLIQRQNQITNWKVANDYNSVTFNTTNASLCNKDSIVKIFVKESEYPFHILNTIKVDGQELYRKAQ